MFLRTLSLLVVIISSFSFSAYGSFRSRNINLAAGKSMINDGEYVGTEKITLSVGEEFGGKGYLEAPNIEISTGKFTFSGTIKCDGQCIIRSEIPFDSTIFKRQGSGKFIIEKLEKKESTSTPLLSATKNTFDADLEQALRYRNNRDVKKAAEYFALAAEKGSLLAMIQLGVYYCEGNGVEKNDKKGFELLSQAVEKGAIESEPFAAYYLGLCYCNGTGVQENEEKAFELFKKGAEKGSTDAILAVAQCYYYGIGVKEDACEARKWCDKVDLRHLTSKQNKLYWELIKPKPVRFKF